MTGTDIDEDGGLRLAAGGQVLRYPAIWLRDNCPCAQCADPRSGQKLHDITDLAPDTTIVRLHDPDNSKKRPARTATPAVDNSKKQGDRNHNVLGDTASDQLSRDNSKKRPARETLSAGDNSKKRPAPETFPAGDNSKKLVVVFGPDGHVGEYDVGWLVEHALDGRIGGNGRPGQDERRLWDGPGDVRPVHAEWARYTADAGERERVLGAVVRDGFALLTGVPADEGMVLAVAESFGFVRETNYGKLFDVRIEPAPGNLAFTSREILPHTDNPYRDPVPTLQLLHCLRVADQGGDTGLVDGFAAARALQAEDRVAYDTITSTPVSFEYSDMTAELRTSQPLIQLGPGGRAAGIRFNNRSVRAVRLPYEQTVRFYQAYRTWAELLARPERRLNTRLAPGDCLIFDNTRILHARTAFSVTGSRHLQGCYADMDGLRSTLATIRRNGDRRTQ